MQQIGLLLLAGLVWASSALNATCTPQEQQLVEFVGKVGPNPYEKVSAEQCHDELHTFFKGIQDYAESHDLHGHWIREMHSKQCGQKLLSISSSLRVSLSGRALWVPTSFPCLSL